MFSDSEVNQRWTSYGRGGIPSATLVYNTRGQSYREVQTAELAKLEPRLAKTRCFGRGLASLLTYLLTFDFRTLSLIHI